MIGRSNSYNDNCDVTILSNVNERVHIWGGGDLETFKNSVRTTQ